jgi:hypothetical protein
MAYDKKAIDEMINESLNNTDMLNSIPHSDVSSAQKQESYNKILKLADKLHIIAKKVENNA